MKLSLLIIAGVLMITLGIYCKDKSSHDLKKEFKKKSKRELAVMELQNGERIVDVYLQERDLLITTDTVNKKSDTMVIAERWGKPFLDSTRDVQGKAIIDSLTKKPTIKIAGYDSIGTSSIVWRSFLDYDSLIKNRK